MQAFSSLFLQTQAQANQAAAELQRVWRKHEAARRELRELGDAWAAERRELREQAATLQQQLTLKDLVIESLVPRPELERVSGMLITAHQIVAMVSTAPH